MIGGYEILGELGRGASARVFRARGPGGAVVALKLLAAAAADDAQARFDREQRLLVSLGEAEGFVPVLDAGLSEKGPFFVMPLLEGGTLRDRLGRGPLATEETLQLGRRLATAIGWAHERGIVHRDLKPENVLFTRDGRPLVADLGIAKRFDPSLSASQSITDRGAFLGTPRYMAPEQMDCSKSVDARADVYALGVILYECLTGRPPYDGANIQELIARVTTGVYERVGDVRNDTPLALAHPIGVALRQDPEARYADGFTFAHALGARLPQRARLQPTVHEGPPRPRRSLPALWLVSVGALVVAALLTAGRRAPTGVKAEVVATVLTATRATPAPPVAKGWFGEPLPAGLRTGGARPLYIFDSGKGLELEMVYVPPGEFFMGAINGNQQEKPLHIHPMPRGYYVGRTETTWEQYLQFCHATGHAEPQRPTWFFTDAHPVIFVSWHDASAFCAWAGLALPTEPEWEKAARGSGDARQWPWGDEWVEGAANILDASSPEVDAGNMRETTSDGWPYTAPVGTNARGASPCEALDMAGNVWEWTADWFDPAIYNAYSNGRTAPPDNGTQRAVRGGSWRHSRFNATVVARFAAEPATVVDYIGFRPILRLQETAR